MPADDRSAGLAARLARARHDLAVRAAGIPPWADLTDQERRDSTLEAQHYLTAAAAAGFAIAVLTDGEAQRPARVTAGMRDTHDQPLDRDEYAGDLQQRADEARGQERLPVLSEGEGLAAAELLDELAAVYRGEPLGQLARELALRLYDRLGI